MSKNRDAIEIRCLCGKMIGVTSAKALASLSPGQRIPFERPCSDKRECGRMLRVYFVQGGYVTEEIGRRTRPAVAEASTQRSTSEPSLLALRT